MSKLVFVSQFILLLLLSVIFESKSQSNGNKEVKLATISNKTNSDYEVPPLHENHGGITEENSENNNTTSSEIMTIAMLSIIHIPGGIYAFMALLITCQEFFVPSLQIIGRTFAIQEDVLGAGLMAVGLGVLELSVVFGVIFMSSGDQDMSEIAGASLFNVFFVLGTCGILTKVELTLGGWPLFRDVGFYLGSIIGMMIFFRDSVIQWWEALLLITIYVLYFGVLSFSNRIEKALCKNKQTVSKEVEDGNEVNVTQLNAKNTQTHGPENTVDNAAENLQALDNWVPRPAGNSILTWPQGKSVGHKIYFLLTFPIRALLHITLPNMRVPHGKIVLIWGYFGSVLWISLLSWILFVCVNVLLLITRVLFSNTNLNSPTSGVTIFFLGSLQTLIACVVAVRKGLGRMAVSCCIALNTFCFAFALPISWFVYILFSQSPVHVGARGLMCLVTMIVGMVVVLVLTILMFRWKMNKCFGVTFLVWYALFFLVVLAFDYRVFTCPSFS